MSDIFTIYRDVPVPIRHKIWHIHKFGGILHKDFTKDFGDIPIITKNHITGLFELVVNTRGYGYACRNRKCFRKRKTFWKSKKHFVD